VLRLPGLLIFVLDLAVLVGIILHALRRRFDDSDRGVGNVVVLPKPHPPSLWRVACFLAVCVLGSIGLIGLRSPDLSKAYRSAVAYSTTRILPEPAVVDAYVSHLRPVIPLSFLAFAIALARLRGAG
jgi:hypothetical protein